MKVWVDERGSPMAQPAEVTEAIVADSLARRYGQRPTDVLAWDAHDLRIAQIATLMEATDGG